MSTVSGLAPRPSTLHAYLMTRPIGQDCPVLVGPVRPLLLQGWGSGDSLGKKSLVPIPLSLYQFRYFPVRKTTISNNATLEKRRRKAPSSHVVTRPPRQNCIYAPPSQHATLQVSLSESRIRVRGRGVLFGSVIGGLFPPRGSGRRARLPAHYKLNLVTLLTCKNAKLKVIARAGGSIASLVATCALPRLL